jgi:hypothetical protein
MPSQIEFNSPFTINNPHGGIQLVHHFTLSNISCLWLGEKITCTMHTILDAINTNRIVFLLLTNFSQIPTYRANWLPLSLKKKKIGAIG